jgi:hypothetical protein
VIQILVLLPQDDDEDKSADVIQSAPGRRLMARPRATPRIHAVVTLTSRERGNVSAVSKRPQDLE